MASIKQQGDQTRIYNSDDAKPRLKKLHKKALLSYLVQPVIESMNGQELNRFSNAGLAVSWPVVLNRLGYSVDIINWDDNKFMPEHAYDLVIVHGGKNFQHLQKHLKPGYMLIYFSTGTYWKFGNAQEDKRLHDFKKRHGISLPRDRFVLESEESVNRSADGIIGLGNDFTKSTYKKFDNAHMINIANYQDNHFERINKDYAASKDSWLFFAGGGNIHKGLDLVIEAFKDLPQKLYIITPLEKSFIEAYKNGARLKNIHFIGEVPMRTEKFYEIVDKCAFQIFPSCSEGQPGSVTEAMNQGIIPIVSKESGLDAERYGMVLKENTIECIKKSVQQMSALDPHTVERMSKNVRGVALRDHNPEKFIKDLRSAVQEIVEYTQS